jgi:hypothetical protein
LPGDRPGNLSDGNYSGGAGNRNHAEVRDLLGSCGDVNVEMDRDVPIAEAKCANPRELDASRRNPASTPPIGSVALPSPRTAMLVHLTEDMRAALAAGDVEAALLAHDVIGRLLGARGTSGAIVDLGAAREWPAER